jgi:predicted Zn-dependent peptidase
LRSEHRITKLDSGVRVATERMDSVRSVALGFWIGAGSALESTDQAGISHLLEHMLFRGTDRYGPGDIDRIFDAMGSTLEAETDREDTTLHARVLDQNLEQAARVMAEMVWAPSLNDLQAEREVVLEEIAAYEDDPQERVFDVLGQAIFGAHPLGRPVIGSVETVAQVSAEDLRAYHAAWYVPGNVVLAAAGNVDHDALVEIVTAAGVIEGEPAPRTAPAPAADRRVRFVVKDTEQYHVCIGGLALPYSDERRFALYLLDNMLGSLSYSRLFEKVRERGLAYSVYSFDSQYSTTGEVGVYVGTRPENLAETISVVAQELERLLVDPAEQQELARSRANARGRLLLSLESPMSRMGNLGHCVLGDIPILSPDEVMQRIDAVTVDDLRELARELYTPASLSIAGIGPDEQAFMQAIEALGAGDGRGQAHPSAPAEHRSGETVSTGPEAML